MGGQDDTEVARRLRQWARETLDDGVRRFCLKMELDASLLEAKPAWVFPPALLIGLVREQGAGSEQHYFINGDAPFEFVSRSAAATPREAARYFVMKWHLDAARLRDSAAKSSLDAAGIADIEMRCERFETCASALFELVEEGSIWGESQTAT